jgi:hypothetical protein
MTVAFREWRWGKLPVYNGFVHAERVRGWQLIWWLVDTGRLPYPRICCITGSSYRVGYHSENYYGWAPYPLAQPVHFALHQRFTRPLAWTSIVSQHATTGDEWFARLSLEPTDVARELRQSFGAEVAQVFATAPFPLPRSDSV